MRIIFLGVVEVKIRFGARRPHEQATKKRKKPLSVGETAVRLKNGIARINDGQKCGRAHLLL
jgi:hypothetical protein